MDMVIIGSGLAILFAMLWWRRSDASFHSSASSAQAIVTAAALVIAGYWYFIERKGQPHANVTQTVEAHLVSPGVVALEVHIVVENLGQRLLRLRRARVRVQQVAPSHYSTVQLVKRSGDDLWKARWEATDERPPRRVFIGPEFNWPTIKEFNGPIENDIEPGEKDLVIATFFIPCGIDEVRIASNVEKDRSVSDKAMMWKARSFVDLRKSCEEGEK